MLSSRPPRLSGKGIGHGKGHLVPPGPQHRKVIVVAEQPVGRGLHVRPAIHLGRDPARNAEHPLDEQRPLDQPAVAEMRLVAKVADVVALELEPPAAPEMLRFSDPTFVAATSHRAHFAVASRSSCDRPGPPPVVMVATASQASLMTGRNRA